MHIRGGKKKEKHGGKLRKGMVDQTGPGKPKGGENGVIGARGVFAL
jgi:hypothetical protein